MHRHPAKTKGFTLVEAIIAIALMALLLAIGLAGLKYATQSGQRDSVQASQIHALKTLFDAASRYTATRVASMPADTTELAIQSLKDAKLLNNGWEGQYSPGENLTPLGQRYAVLVNRSADNATVSVTIAELGTPPATLLSRWDIRDAAGIKSWKNSVAQAYRRRYGEEVWLLEPVGTGAPRILPMSLGAVGQTSVVATQDQMPTPASLTYDSIAISSRWSDSTKDTNESQVAIDDASTCEVVAPIAGIATCPSGKTQVASLPYQNCRYQQPTIMLNTPAGRIGVSQEEEIISPDAAKCGRSCDAATNPGCDAGVNGANMATTLTDGTSQCRSSVYTTAQANQLKLIASQSSGAGYYRLKASGTGGYAPVYYDRIWMDVFTLESRPIARQMCLEDRWVTGAGSPALIAGTAQLRSIGGSPPNQQALCCKIR